MPFTTWAAGDVITSAKLNNDNTVAVATDTARTITVTHTWTASQTFTGGFTAGAASTVTANFTANQLTSLGSVIVASSSNLQFGTGTKIFQNADGQLILSNAATNDFSLLMFGFNTAAYPALKRSGASIVARLADDSATTNLQASTVIVDGVKFPATQSPSADVNTLDDYEEGTWTPTDNSGAGLTLSSVTATYTKIGKLVVATCRLTYPVTASGANASITGLPFTVANQNGNCGGALTYADETTLRYVLVTANTTTATMYDSAGANVTNATMSGNTINVTFVYQATA